MIQEVFPEDGIGFSLQARATLEAANDNMKEECFQALTDMMLDLLDLRSGIVPEGIEFSDFCSLFIFSRRTAGMTLNIRTSVMDIKVVRRANWGFLVEEIAPNWRQLN